MDGVNYVKFNNILASAGETITMNLSKAPNHVNGSLNGFQIVAASEPSTAVLLRFSSVALMVRRRH